MTLSRRLFTGSVALLPLLSTSAFAQSQQAKTNPKPGAQDSVPGFITDIKNWVDKLAANIKNINPIPATIKDDIADFQKATDDFYTAYNDINQIGWPPSIADVKLFLEALQSLLDAIGAINKAVPLPFYSTIVAPAIPLVQTIIAALLFLLNFADTFSHLFAFNAAAIGTRVRMAGNAKRSSFVSVEDAKTKGDAAGKALSAL